MDRRALGYLTDLNRNVEDALTVLAKLAEYPELSHEGFTIHQSYFREFLADANIEVMDALEDFELETMTRASKERVSYEKRIRDPDDCYFEVMRREEELRAQGKPSKIGILHGTRSASRKEILGSPQTEDEIESDQEEGSDPDGEIPASRNEGSP
ncbi:MAG TPA: hypothetical protein VNW54_02605 [Granulicella sp.]|nr:hypothetical protein [Granulicella sp.]